jgi:coenzyme F420 hydrogenase subunit beta
VRTSLDDPGPRRMDREVGKVVRSGNCSGCGMCTLLDTGLQMRIDESGYSRPVREDAGVRVDHAAERFRQACPGKRVAAQRPTGATWHPTMGPVIAVWAAWASDAETRERGSSGGVLTALAAWLTSAGVAAQVVGAAADIGDPRRTVPVTITSRAEALASAGSRYAPVSVAGNAAVQDAMTAVIGKPCEVSAVRALAVANGTEPPLLLSFYCAGTPRQSATTELLGSLGVDSTRPLAGLWYRGHGWPGRFTAVPETGPVVSTSYSESWGNHLGPTIQWRCKICPDGVGESADITAADFWTADELGYPVFAEGDGVSALIARTPRGRDVIERALAAGVLEMRSIDIDALAAVQPTQRKRRETLAGRLAGAVFAGVPIPRFTGFRLLRLGLAHPRGLVRSATGTFHRARAAGGTWRVRLPPLGVFRNRGG